MRENHGKTIITLYSLHHDRKKVYTYYHFKNSGYGKSEIYSFLNNIDERGNIDRKLRSGQPNVLTPNDKKKLKKLINHKTGVSQRKLANHFEVVYFWCLLKKAFFTKFVLTHQIFDESS